MKIVVTGGRDFTDKAFVYDNLDRLNAEHGPFTLVGHGDARGVDHFAFRWAVDRKIAWRLFVAHWTKEGDSAGPIRNGKMLREVEPALVIAFPGGTGTLDCCMQAQARGIKVIAIKQEKPPKGGLLAVVAKRKLVES